MNYLRRLGIASLLLFSACTQENKGTIPVTQEIKKSGGLELRVSVSVEYEENLDSPKKSVYRIILESSTYEGASRIELWDYAKDGIVNPDYCVKVKGLPEDKDGFDRVRVLSELVPSPSTRYYFINASQIIKPYGDKIKKAIEEHRK